MALTCAEHAVSYLLPYSDLVCASIHNDLGVLLKVQGQLAEAKAHYTTALDIRK